MAYNVGDLVDKVQKRVRDTGFSSTTIIELLDDTQNDVFNEYTFPFMQTSQDYVLTANDEDITSGNGLPDNYAVAQHLTLTSAGRESNVPFVDFRWIEENYPDPTDTSRNPAGVPRYAYFANGTVNVYPVPNEAFNATLTFRKKPAELTSGDDVPDIPAEFRELLVVGAAYRVMQIKDNYDIAGVLQNKYDEILQKLAVRYNKIQVGAPKIMRINRRAVGKANF